tara:strand:- start:11896 stop:13251 length:1356 start_codon:yes stop_codon:yes gene_type:complete
MAKNIESKSSGESVMQPTITGSRNHLTPNKPYAVVDVGSTKIAIAVLNMDENPQLIYGCASTKTTAVTKGKVTDIDVLSNNISETLKKALNSNEIPNEIPGIVSISGTHVKGVNEIESLTLNNSHGVITFEDINSGITNKYGYNNNPHSSRRVINEHHINYILDGEHAVINPIGMHSQDIKIKKHIISGDISEVEKLESAAKKAGVDVRGLVHGGTASSLATIKNANKTDNLIMLDIGGGTTDISIYESNCLIYSSVLPIGGFNFSNDIAIALGIDYTQAENIKIRHGLTDIYKPSVLDSFKINLPDSKVIEIPVLDLCQIMKERAQELAGLILMEIESSGITNLKNCALTGGSSQIDGIDKILTKTLQLKTNLCRPSENQYLTSEYLSPEYSTLAGMTTQIIDSKPKLLNMNSNNFEKLTQMSKLPIINKTSTKIKKLIKKPYLKSVRGK